MLNITYQVKSSSKDAKIQKGENHNMSVQNKLTLIALAVLQLWIAFVTLNTA
jgi:hypothetical protein